MRGVIVVDDMITTDWECYSGCRICKNGVSENIFVTSISTHNLKRQNDAFAANHVLARSLFKTTDLFDVAYAKEFITGKRNENDHGVVNTIDG